MPETISLFWLGFTRLGEAQILLPATLAVYGWTIWRAPASRACASRWLMCVALAAVLTTITKVAFIGYGVGNAALDFTGLSGHAMFSAAILPVLMRLLVVDQSPRRARAMVALGYVLAFGVAVSRVQVDAHSVSEVIGGALCGGAASALALTTWRHLPVLRVPALPAWVRWAEVRGSATRSPIRQERSWRRYPHHWRRARGPCRLRPCCRRPKTHEDAAQRVLPPSTTPI